MNYIINPSDFPFRNEEFREYAMYLPLLYEHREEIYANAAYFYAPLPYSIYGLKKATCIGALLKAYDKGMPYRTVCKDNSRVEYLTEYAGNPMTGTTTGWKVVVTGHTVTTQRFKYCGFLSLVHRLAECFYECELPYQKSSITIHDIITQLKKHEENSSI